MTPSGDVVVQHRVATEDDVRRGLRRLASPDRPNRMDETKIDAIDEMETNTMMSQRKVSIVKTSPLNTRVTQRWPTFRSVFRDNASKFNIYQI